MEAGGYDASSTVHLEGTCRRVAERHVEEFRTSQLTIIPYVNATCIVEEGTSGVLTIVHPTIGVAVDGGCPAYIHLTTIDVPEATATLATVVGGGDTTLVDNKGIGVLNSQVTRKRNSTLVIEDTCAVGL